MYRPPIGPVSAIERAIVCMRMPGLADLRQPISRGFLHTATSGGAPGFFYARCARKQVDRSPKEMPPKAKPKFPFLLIEQLMILALDSEGLKRAKEFPY